MVFAKSFKGSWWCFERGASGKGSARHEGVSLGFLVNLVREPGTSVCVLALVWLVLCAASSEACSALAGSAMCDVCFQGSWEQVSACPCSVPAWALFVGD